MLIEATRGATMHAMKLATLLLTLVAGAQAQNFHRWLDTDPASSHIVKQPEGE